MYRIDIEIYSEIRTRQWIGNLESRLFREKTEVSEKISFAVTKRVTARANNGGVRAKPLAVLVNST